jgi:hypothetical protein
VYTVLFREVGSSCVDASDKLLRLKDYEDTMIHLIFARQNLGVCYTHTLRCILLNSHMGRNFTTCTPKNWIRPMYQRIKRMNLVSTLDDAEESGVYRRKYDQKQA